MIQFYSKLVLDRPCRIVKIVPNNKQTALSKEKYSSKELPWFDAGLKRNIAVEAKHLDAQQFL